MCVRSQFFRSGKLAEVSRFVLIMNFRSWFPVPAQLLGHESEVPQFNFTTKRDVRYTLRINNRLLVVGLVVWCGAGALVLKTLKSEAW